MPIDPVTALAASAAQLHELYDAYLHVGFNDRQAMQLVCEILRTSLTAGSA